MDESNAGAGFLLAGAAIPALSAWSSFSCSQRCPQHPCAVSASVLVGSTAKTSEQRQAALSLWWLVQRFVLLTKSRQNFQLGPSGLSWALQGVSYQNCKHTHFTSLDLQIQVTALGSIHIFCRNVAWCGFFLPSNYIRGRNEVKDEIAIRNNARVQNKWNKWGKKTPVRQKLKGPMYVWSVHLIRVRGLLFIIHAVRCVCVHLSPLLKGK